MTRTGETLLVFGPGYSGRALALAAQAAGFSVIATSRSPGERQFPPGITGIDFTAAEPAIDRATHLLATAPPAEAGDPVLTRYAANIATAPRLRWIGYLSTTGVYGDHGGGWVDEDTPPAPGSARTRRRLAAEADWAAVRGACGVDVFRLAGIYGPGRSALDDLRAGTARRIVKPGHQFGRIHRDDIAQAVLAGMRQAPLPGPRILNLADDTPDETARVVEEAARLLGVEPPVAVPFAEAWSRMSPMARSFWTENRKVASRKTQAALGIAWRYPSYREGLRAILAEQRLEGPAQ
ncbi:MAG: SDR family oxidoreductase [Acetobacteraceae bacterium]